MAMEQAPRGNDQPGVQMSGTPANEQGWNFGQDFSGLASPIPDLPGVALTDINGDMSGLSTDTVAPPNGMAMGVLEQGDGMRGGQDEAFATQVFTDFSEALVGTGRNDAAAGGPQHGFDAMAGLQGSGEPVYQSVPGTMGEQNTR